MGEREDTPGTVAHVFDPRNNALNAWRLLLATEVILFHSFPLTGHMPPAPLRQLMFSAGVDGFFTISGFLITASWLRRPQPRQFLTARALRILPGLWICLAITAFVIAPLAVFGQGGSVKDLLLSDGPIGYVWKNMAIHYVQGDINGTPLDVPYPGKWNGSLWSLIFEVACYLAVAILGVIGLTKYRWTAVVLYALGVVLALLLPPLTFLGFWTLPQLLARTMITFAAGAIIYQWRDAMPARWSLVALCTGITIAAGIWLPAYLVVAGLPLAYAVITSGILLKHRRLNLRNDISYGAYIYAFPTQQLLASWGLFTLAPLAFFAISTAATFPLAVASWFLIEKRAIALKGRMRMRRGVNSPESDLDGNAALPSIGV